MLISELCFTHRQALAKEIRCFVENDTSKPPSITKEAELRKFLVEKHLEMRGISDVESLLKSHYNNKTTSRILSKIQKSVVLDTCMCNLPIEEIEKMLLNQDYNFIVTTDVYKELIKLSNSSETEVDNVKTAQKLLNFILSDSESAHCTIIDVPSQKYVDNQLISFCKENKYSLYTYDYTLGLRAKVRNINAKIFTKFNKYEINYEPNPLGKNILLCKDIISDTSLNNILSIAKEMGANKFILTDKLVEELETMKNSTYTYLNNERFYEWIRFFIVDDSDNYLILSQYDSETSLKAFVEENNAVIFSKDLETCMKCKMNFIPYKFVDCPSLNTFTNTLLDISRTKTDNSTASKSNGSEIVKNLITDINKTSAIIPYYKSKDHILSLSNIRNDEEMFVIDQFGEEVKPDFKKEILLQPKYRVVYFHKVSKKSSKPLKITVFNVINMQSANYGTAIYSAYIDKSDACLAELPREYVLYARKTIL